MVDIDVTLKAKNSSGEQSLSLTYDNGEFLFTLSGEYRGEYIQIDFEEVTKADLEDIRTQITLVLEAAKGE